MQPLDKIDSLKSFLWENQPSVKNEKTDDTKNDSIEISNTARVYDKIDKFLNLGRPDRLDIDDLNEEEKKEFYKMLADLINNGIIGYEILEVKGKPEKHFLDTQIGDHRIYGARLYKKNGYYKD
jgi:hypothetical protein